MSDAESDAESISDSSNAHVDDGGDDGGEALISVAVRRLCNQLRANDPRVLGDNSSFAPLRYITGYSAAEYIAIFQALKENTSEKHIDFTQFKLHCTKRSALVVAAEYVESSKTLQTLDLWVDGFEGSQEMRQEMLAVISVLLRALSRNTSVTKLFISTDVIGFASVAFQELLTCTQTLQKLLLFGSEDETLDDVQTAAIASSFANNTTLRDLEFNSWREADLAQVLTALQDHPALQKIHFGASLIHAESLGTRSFVA
jgi:hypothetical protein